MARRDGEYSLSETASALEVHSNTVRRWAQNAVAGIPSRLSSVRIDVVGRYWIHSRDIDRLRAEERALNYLGDVELDPGVFGAG